MLPAQTGRMGSSFVGRAITGMPYSAQETTERVQTLADGTHITQPSQRVMHYRDSQGRTRTERTIARPPGVARAGSAALVIIEISDPVSGVGYTLDPRSHVAQPRQFIVLPAPPPSANARPTPAVIPGQRERPQISQESLGTQTIEGIAAQGERSTIIYPTGYFGNDRPITRVAETWISPDLRRVVLSKTSDPRTGESR